MKSIIIALLCIVQVINAEDPCSSLGRDLECSACSNFIEGVFTEVSRAPSALVKKGGSTNNLWHEKKDSKKSKPATAEKVYEQRIKAIYKTHAPDKEKGVSALLKKSKGGEHELYVRICTKYGVSPEAEYDPKAVTAPSEDDTALWKFAAAEEAIAATVASASAESKIQWAKSGVDGKRAFVDFNKAMQGGTLENLSMGGDVSKELHACMSHLAKEHENTIITAIAESEKPYSSGLHKKFCKEVGCCGAKKATEL